MKLNRRQLLQAAPASLLLPSISARAAQPGERRFLFIYADGGWDTTWVFNPDFGNPNIDMPADGSSVATLGDLRWVSGPGRPSVDRFFQTWGSRTCMLNGIDVRSIAHERCRRLVFTASAAMDGLDIPSRIALAAPSQPPLGHLVFSGPAFLDAQSNSVVRIGASGQLASLIDGTCVSGTDDLRLPNTSMAALEDRFVAQRAADAAIRAGQGAEARIHAAYSQSLDNIPVAEENVGLLNTATDITAEQLRSAVDVLGTGLARCALVTDKGFQGERWDHHTDLNRQVPSYDFLFQNLENVCAMLASQSGTWGNTLLDEITIVVFSEMGRFPRYNAAFGKDHWMTSSMLLIGGGIQGGTTVGGYTDSMNAEAIDLSTGLPSAAGVVPEPIHLAATLLTLADIDPVEAYGPEAHPLAAALA